MQADPCSPPTLTSLYLRLSLCSSTRGYPQNILRPPSYFNSTLGCLPLSSLPLEARSYAQVARRRLKPQKILRETHYLGLELHLDKEGLHFLGSKALDSSPRVHLSPPCP